LRRWTRKPVGLFGVRHSIPGTQCAGRNDSVIACMGRWFQANRSLIRCSVIGIWCDVRSFDVIDMRRCSHRYGRHGAKALTRGWHLRALRVAARRKQKKNWSPRCTGSGAARKTRRAGSAARVRSSPDIIDRSIQSTICSDCSDEYSLWPDPISIVDDLVIDWSGQSRGHSEWNFCMKKRAGHVRGIRWSEAFDGIRWPSYSVVFNCSYGRLWYSEPFGGATLIRCLLMLFLPGGY